MKLTQQDGARLMYAASKWADARAARCVAARSVANTVLHAGACKQDKAAEQRFAELVAEYTDSEGL
jgi:hypothetical protein